MSEKEKYPRSFAEPEDKEGKPSGPEAGKNPPPAEGVYAAPGFFSPSGNKTAQVRMVYAAPMPPHRRAFRIGGAVPPEGFEGMRDSPGESQKPSFCTECGTRLPQGAKYCPECGKRVNKSSDLFV